MLKLQEISRIPSPCSQLQGPPRTETFPFTVLQWRHSHPPSSAFFAASFQPQAWLPAASNTNLIPSSVQTNTDGSLQALCRTVAVAPSGLRSGSSQELAWALHWAQSGESAVDLQQPTGPVCSHTH